MSHHAKRGPKSKFSQQEDEKLAGIVEKLGGKGWTKIARRMRNKTAKQCRERWQNYLNPRLQFRDWNSEDDKLLMKQFRIIGPHWTAIGASFPNRSVNSIRNRWIKLSRSHLYDLSPLNSESDSDSYSEYESDMSAPLSPKERENEVVEQTQDHKELNIDKTISKVFESLETEIQSYDMFLQTDPAESLIDMLCNLYY